MNLLETSDVKCQNGSLSVLLQIATSAEMKRYLIDLDIATPLIQMLKHPARDIQVRFVALLPPNHPSLIQFAATRSYLAG